MNRTDDEEILAIAQAGFMDEASEMLAQFEAGLLAMENDPGDAEAVNSAFRAAHTIKGTSGLFGFHAVVAFTHEVESVLDSMRDGSLPVVESAMALLLQGRDQIERLVGEIGQAPDPEVAALSESLAARLRGLKAPTAAQTESHGTSAAPDKASNDTTAGATDTGAPPVWHISLRLGTDALRNGLDPLSFIRYLDRLGHVEAIRTLVDGVPDLAAIDPESCYLGFEIRLATSASGAEVEQVFEFLMDDCDLALVAPDAGPSEYTALLARRGDDAATREALMALAAATGQRLLPADDGADTAANDITSEPVARAASPIAASPAVAATAAVSPPGPERRQQGPDRRENPAERRAGTRDRRAPEETRFIRVRADKLDRLIDLIGELVIAGSGAQLVAQQEQSPRFAEAALRIHDLVQEARDGALGLRMVPIGDTFARFQRVVRDVSKQLEKEVELQITGADTELDKSMVDTIADPLMHLVRNSLDHGIEMPADRRAAGKPAAGQLALHAYHESGSVVIEVSDDGRGLDRTRILAKAVERGLVRADAELSDDDIYQLIFAPGFSTAEQVTNLSGRGVGMDVVKRNVESLRGQIKVASLPGRGATMQIRLPLTLAIIDGFLTSVGGVSYVLPLEIVAECIEVPATCRLSHGPAGCFDLRGEVVPYISLRALFGHSGEAPPRQSLIVVRNGGGRLGLMVDRLHGEYQTVIKPIGAIFEDLEGIAGATILGSGEVALILDVAALEQRVATDRRRDEPDPPARHAATLPALAGTPADPTRATAPGQETEASC